jgi:hypothetical protein
MEYTFKNNAGVEVIVQVDDEEAARKAAMAKLYGPKPDEAWLGKEWLGIGLDLVALR